MECDCTTLEFMVESGRELTKECDCMKKIIASVLVLVYMLGLVGCNTSNTKETSLEDRRAMIMVEGTLYFDTNKVSTVEREDSLFDGVITSAVNQGEIPTKNDQSNFGTGYGYQYGTDGTVEVYINEKWAVFEAEPIG